MQADKDFEKVLDVIYSCETEQHLVGARELRLIFLKKYSKHEDFNHFDSFSSLALSFKRLKLQRKTSLVRG